MKQVSLDVHEEEGSDYESIRLASEIDFDTKFGEPRTCISIDGKHLMGYGDISVLLGRGKSMKTVLKNTIVASYLSKNTRQHFDKFQGHENEGKMVLDFDTEQSGYHVKRNVNMIHRLIGQKVDNYKSYQLRKFPYNERLGFIKYMINDVYKGKVGFVTIDGLGDLVRTTNDEEQSYAVAQDLMALSDESDCHICGLLHLNPGSRKPKGHLGTAMLIKIESALFLERQEGGYVKVETDGYVRNADVDPFEFTLTKQFLPQIKGDEPFVPEEGDTPF